MSVGAGKESEAELATEAGTATVPEQLDHAVPRHERLMRALSVTIVALVVGGALTGLLGARSAVVAAEENGYRLEVVYAHIIRPGLSHQLSFEASSVDSRLQRRLRHTDASVAHRGAPQPGHRRR